ncbi:copper amine oxidase N-terminal domain-containing protein [Anaerotignum lactatifermentans]|uniref:copper amine oxidase N-terminal domain-containing protein n=1 Tax=Anaerotignum lactatifermentans TaxID=160404 RepID=UPI00266D20F7|nr:copper amine oxidase N-terminal domain-containing protein [Anaerotignum lactatifermentans]
MKFQRMKDVCLGATVAALVMGAAPAAYAKVANMDIPVMFNNIKIVVDGKELKTDKEPFIYEGTTYLPVRAVGEAVGKNVTWDAASKTVILGETEQKEQEKEPEQPEETTSDNDSRLGKLASKPSTNVNNMKIQCTGVRESAGYIDGIEVDFKFTNNSDFEQTVWLDSLKVNNKDVEGSLYTKILGDRSETDRLTIEDSDLKRAGIDKIYNISVVFRVYNHDDWDDVTTNEMIMNFN